MGAIESILDVRDELASKLFFCGECAYVGIESQHKGCGHPGVELRSVARAAMAEKLTEALAELRERGIVWLVTQTPEARAEADRRIMAYRG